MRIHHVAVATMLALVAYACTERDSPTAPTSSQVTVPSLALVGGSGATAPIRSTFATGKCMDVTGISQTPGTPLQLWSCSGGTNQQFTWRSDATIRVYSAAICLDTKGTANGSPVVIAPCAGTTQQKWTATAAGAIRNTASGRCVDITNRSTANGARLQLWSCSGGANQTWDNSASGGGGGGPPPVGTPIYPGQSVQAAVNAAPAGTTFLLKAGTHVRQTVIPKAGNVFRGEPGAVLDGQHATQYAFLGRGSSGWVNNVTIRGLKIINYVPPAQDGTIAAGMAPGNATSGWVLDSLDVSYNGQYGIRIGDNMRVTRSKLHHNWVLNISGGGNNTIVDGNEIAYGNYANSGSANFESGGTKFVLTNGLILRNNYVHDNVGVGLWVDADNINALIENNRVEHNGSEGIALEVSYKTVVRYNTVLNNGWFDPRGRRWLWNAGIGVHATSDVEVYGNTVGGNMNGIVAIQQARGSGKYGPYKVTNLYVHDNTVTQTTIPPPFTPSAAGGAVTDCGDLAMFTSRNNRWVHNTYYTGLNLHPFEWQGSWHTPAQWRALGQDVTGIFH